MNHLMKVITQSSAKGLIFLILLLISFSVLGQKPEEYNDHFEILVNNQLINNTTGLQVNKKSHLDFRYSNFDQFQIRIIITKSSKPYFNNTHIASKNIKFDQTYTDIKSIKEDKKLIQSILKIKGARIYIYYINMNKPEENNNTINAGGSVFNCDYSSTYPLTKK